MGDPKALNTFKCQLPDLRRILVDAEETGARGEEVVKVDQTRHGRLSRMDAMQSQAMSLATGAKRRQLLREIEALLQRFKDGSFGECLEPISPERLTANLVARHGITCAEAPEANNQIG